MIKTGSWSPWGTIDLVTYLGDEGAAFVSTPSHGGIYLPFLLAKKMPAPLVDASFLKTDTWWEEDCDAAWPMLVLSLGTDEQIEQARDFLDSFKPTLLRAWHTTLDMEA